MCIIVFAPKGELMPRYAFDYARKQNSDGIGIVSAYGVAKFLGKKAGKKAWKELKFLSEHNEPYGLHFRWATHGAIIKALVHPFHAPQSDAYVMHNGIISQCTADSTDWISDSLVYVSKYMRDCPSPDDDNYKAWFDAVEIDMGYSNKLLIYHSTAKKFTLVNEDLGNWIDGLWYSNTYSLPALMVPEDERWGRFNYANAPSWNTSVENGYMARGSTTGISLTHEVTAGGHTYYNKRYNVVTGKWDLPAHAGKPLLPGGPTLDTVLAKHGLDNISDDDVYDDENELAIGEKAADRLDEVPPTAEDVAWLRNRQLTTVLDRSERGHIRGFNESPLDKWADHDAYAAMVKRRAAEVV